jgi:hypothetical protein
MGIGMDVGDDRSARLPAPEAASLIETVLRAS